MVSYHKTNHDVIIFVVVFQIILIIVHLVIRLGQFVVVLQLREQCRSPTHLQEVVVAVTARRRRQAAHRRQRLAQ